LCRGLVNCTYTVLNLQICFYAASQRQGNQIAPSAYQGQGVVCVCLCVCVCVCLCKKCNICVYICRRAEFVAISWASVSTSPRVRSSPETPSSGMPVCIYTPPLINVFSSIWSSASMPQVCLCSQGDITHRYIDSMCVCVCVCRYTRLSIHLPIYLYIHICL